MDPLTIATTCITLAATIGKVGLQLNGFVKDVRDARHDLDSVKRELSSLQTVLEVIAEDASNSDITFPPLLTKQLPGILDNCELVVSQIEKLLQKYDGGGLRKGAKWAISGRDDVDKSRVSLEAHKSALDMALEMVAMATIERWQEILPRTAELPVEQYNVLNRYFDSLTAYTARSEDAFSDEESDSELQESLKERDCDQELSSAPQPKNATTSPRSSGDEAEGSSAVISKDSAKQSALEDHHDRTECTNRIIELNSANKKLKVEARSLQETHKTNMQSMAFALNDNFKAALEKLESQVVQLTEKKRTMEKIHSDALKDESTKLRQDHQDQLSRLNAEHDTALTVQVDRISSLETEKEVIQDKHKEQVGVLEDKLEIFLGIMQTNFQKV